MNFINKHYKLIKILAAAAALLAAAAIVIYMKFFYEPGHGIVCFTYKYFGIYCAGCGNTRQLYYLLDGQFAKALSYNVASIIIYPTFAYLYYLLFRWVIFDKKISYKQAYAVAAVAILLILYMIVRNIPIDGLGFLRPPV